VQSKYRLKQEREIIPIVDTGKISGIPSILILEGQAGQRIIWVGKFFGNLISRFFMMIFSADFS
jgi:hypothetical protein